MPKKPERIDIEDARRILCRALDFYDLDDLALALSDLIAYSDTPLVVVEDDHEDAASSDVCLNGRRMEQYP
jgi:hypothetical protein